MNAEENAANQQQPTVAVAELANGTQAPRSNTPSVPEGFWQFDPQSIPASRLTDSIASAVFTILGIGIAIGLYFWLGTGWALYCLLALGVIFLLVLWYFSLFWPSIEHRHRCWRLSDIGLEIKSGVWFKEDQAVPWARVQHADVSQGPIQRMYGIGTLTVYTAGTANSSVAMEGMTYEKAIDLRDEIIRQRKSGDVV